MIPASFDYVRADSAEAALAALAEHGDEAKLLAGGHSLVPLLKLRLAVPAVLVDIGRLEDLSYIRDAGDHLAVGALTRHRDLERSAVLAEHLPLLCTHPGQTLLRGRDRVMASWRGILRRPANVRCRDASVALLGEVAVVTCVELFASVELAATNVFVLEQGRWRMLHHQAGLIAHRDDDDDDLDDGGDERLLN